MRYDLQELWDLVKKIPEGKCATYGDLGRAMHYPATGRMVGRWMANCPDDIPWWRVVNKRGDLPIAKRDAYLGVQQRQLLEKERIPFRNDLVHLEECGWIP
jgi:methylated-DNA-protein-cysteine methyltransferase-like protein